MKFPSFFEKLRLKVVLAPAPYLTLLLKAFFSTFCHLTLQFFPVHFIHADMARTLIIYWKYWIGCISPYKIVLCNNNFMEYKFFNVSTDDKCFIMTSKARQSFEFLEEGDILGTFSMVIYGTFCKLLNYMSILIYNMWVTKKISVSVLNLHRVWDD